MKLQPSVKEALSRKLHDTEVSALSALLAGEISAVDTYNLALEKINDSVIITTLKQCRDSHARRVEVLRGCIKDMGENPPKSAGLWGVVARFAERGATIFSKKVAVNMLAAGEEFGLQQYENHVESLDSDSWKIVEKDLIPAQERTLRIMSSLCSWMQNMQRAR